MFQSTFRKQDKAMFIILYSCPTFKPEMHSNRPELLVDFTQLSYQPASFQDPRERAKERASQKGKGRAKAREAVSPLPRVKVRDRASRLHPSLLPPDPI